MSEQQPQEQHVREESSTPVVDQESRNWAIIVHLASFGALVIPIIGSILGPLVVWLFRKDVSPFVDKHGRESLNFQISMMIYFGISILLCVILIGFLFVWLIPIVDIVFVIIAAIKASNGEEYRYPMTIRFV